MSEMGGYLALSWWVQCHHKHPYGEEAGRRVRVREGGVTVEAEVRESELKREPCWLEKEEGMTSRGL